MTESGLMRPSSPSDTSNATTNFQTMLFRLMAAVRRTAKTRDSVDRPGRRFRRCGARFPRHLVSHLSRIVSVLMLASGSVAGHAADASDAPYHELPYAPS